MNILTLAVTNKGGSRSGLPRIVCCGSWLPEMGFVTGALVQALPEPNGMAFRLCDENIGKYSELSRSTDDRNGKLIQVIYSNNSKNAGPMLTTTGQYILSGGLSGGDTMAVQYTHGLIRMRKAPGETGIVGSRNDKRAGKTVSVIRLFGEWLTKAGFVPDALATAASEPGRITLTLHDNGIEQYSALVKHARVNKLKLFQFRRHNKNEKSAHIDITGSCLERAGFAAGDLYEILREYGLVQLRRIDLKALGF